MSLSSNFPTIKPSLNLDFANVGALDPRITFTRATTATYTNSLGLIATAASGVARFDYDPVTLAARGLLVEESRTNLSTYSEDFSNAAWVSYSASKTANAAAAPSGATTANRIAESASNTLQAIYNTISTSTTGTRTVSVFAKAAERTFFRVSLSGAGSAEWFGATFNLQNGTVTQQNAGAAGTVSGATITAFGSGWYRCTVTGDTGSTGVTYAYIGPALTGTPSAGSFGVLTYSGNSSNGVLAWGAQLEAGSFATSYIPTVASTVTRNADVASINTLTPWFNAAEGTLFAEGGGFGYAVASGRLAGVSDGSTSNRIINFLNSATSLNGLVTTAGVNQANISVSVSSAVSANKIALGYASNNVNAAVNGTIGTLDTSATIPTVTLLRIGSNETGTDGFTNGCIRRIAYYPLRLTDAQLQAITS